MVRVLIAISLLLSPSFAFAQSVGSLEGFGVDPLSVQISPRYPRPYESVTISPSSTTLDLSASTVTVIANGEVVGKGSGNQPYTVQAGGAGSRTAVQISVTGPGGSYSEDIVIRPTDVALVLDPISTSHPFYQGSNLVAPEGRVRLIAIADMRTNANTRLPSSSLIYTWKTGGRLLQAESGIGKSTLNATAPVLFRDTAVSVTVSSADGALVGEASVIVSATNPMLLIYQDSPLEGPRFSEEVSGAYDLNDNEGAFRAVPYFFPSAPSILWQLNGNVASAESTITVRTTGDREGVGLLRAEARQDGAYYDATGELRIRFGALDGGTGFFGL